MSLVRYNGVQLNITRVLSYSAKPVMTDDGADVLYIHHVLRVAFLYHGDATDKPRNAAAIYKSLMTPRRKLLFAIDSRTVLESPLTFGGAVQPGMDAYLGPRPISCDITQVVGTKSAMGEFTIETWTIPPGIASTLIGHRWEETHEIDEVYLTKRSVTGTVWIRSDVALLNKFTVDDFRQSVFHPVPDSFKRQNISVTVGSDGTRLDYSFTDEEQIINYGLDSKIARIEGRYGQGMDMIGNIFPLSWVALTVQVWGTPLIKRTGLVVAVLHIASAYGMGLEAKGNSVKGLFTDMSIWVDINALYAEGSFKYAVSGLSGMGIASIGDAVGLNPVDIREMPDGIVGVAGNRIATFRTGKNPGPANGVACRTSTYTQKALAQALTDPWGTPAAPPAA